MSDPDDHSSLRDILGGLIGGAALSIVGIVMVITPNGGKEAGFRGRTGFFNLLINFLWSTPGGIAATLIGMIIIGLTIHRAKASIKK